MHLNNLTFWQYMLLCTVAFFFIGVKFYLADRIWGVKLYRWWYNITHKTPLPTEPLRGFISNRSAKVRWWWAVWLSTIESGLIVAFGGQNAMVEMFAWLWEIPVLFVGFLAGPTVYRWFKNKDSILNTIDKVESGEISIKETVKTKVGAAVHTAKEAMFGHGKEPMAKPFPEPSKPTVAEMTEVDARAAIDKFTKGGR